VRNRKDGARRLYSLIECKIFEMVDAATHELMNALSKRIVAQIA